MKFISIFLIAFGGTLCVHLITLTLGIMLMILGQIIEDDANEREEVKE